MFYQHLLPITKSCSDLLLATSFQSQFRRLNLPNTKYLKNTSKENNNFKIVDVKT
ncbi:hypothetical protein HanXRQr2_Chr01g0016811 [Helianthus annuus]|uniref:Uncharacterized protein n=1 Tax=Helianthus annuus TaxID=4232 RepID=A0A9K3P1X4_HELAN|nr:hypothetical protein HanXRQr2_Chr01g0016811 [Helianthus annuus]KAJ0956560.1 hypothetical protein HanPSC8_Chr01g0016241 [Helianthus annuus]